MAKLTRAQAFALIDLSSGIGGMGSGRTLGIHLNTLRALTRMNFIEAVRPDLWRITDAGRAALQSKPQGR